jgi:hypothetical protein
MPAPSKTRFFTGGLSCAETEKDKERQNKKGIKNLMQQSYSSSQKSTDEIFEVSFTHRNC